MTPPSILDAVLAAAPGSPALDQLREVLVRGDAVDEIGRGTLSLHEARAMYTIRSRTTADAGIDAVGIDDLLQHLHELVGPTVRLVHLATADRVFTVVLDGAGTAAIGAVAVPRRLRP